MAGEGVLSMCCRALAVSQATGDGAEKHTSAHSRWQASESSHSQRKQNLPA